MANRAGIQVLFRQVPKQKEHAAGALPVKHVGVEAGVTVKRPENKIAFLRVIVRLAEQGENPRDGFALAARDNHDRPGKLPFAVFPPAVVNPGEKRPDHGSVVAPGRTRLSVKQEPRVPGFRIIGADAGGFIEIKRPEREKRVVAADDFRLVESVGARGHVLVLIARQRPELPAGQAVAMPQMKEWIKIVVGDHIPSPGLAVDGKQDEENFFAEQPVVEVAVKWNERGVIFIRNRRALLKIERKQRETLLSRISFGTLAAGKTKKLAQLPAVFPAIMLISQHRIKQIKFL